MNPLAQAAELELEGAAARQAAEDQAVWDVAIGDAARQLCRQRMILQRKTQFKRLRDFESRVDRGLLYNGPHPIDRPRVARDLWFASSDMAGRSGYILQYLGAFCRKLIADDTLANFTQSSIDALWMSKPFDPHPNDTVDYGDNVLDPYTFPRFSWLRDLCNNPNSQIFGGPNPPGNERAWHSLKHIFKLLDHLQLLKRFVDPRNPEVAQKPVPDGSNIEDSFLRASWTLHRAWIRALHYRSLFVGPESYGWDQILQILKVSLAFHEAENLKVSGTKKCPAEFNILDNVFDSVYDAIRAFTADLFLESRPRPSDGPYILRETVIHNLQHERLEALLTKHFGPVDMMFMLWSYLLDHAEEFERRLDIEHVEDVLIDKRVVPQDERDIIYQRLDGTHSPINANIVLRNYQQSHLFDTLAKISQVNRRRRSYRLLRDWARRRPWKQLYYVFDTSDGEGDYLREPIAQFHVWLSNLAALEPSKPHPSDSPSLRYNVFSGLFTFHPIASSDPNPDPIPHFSDGCMICQYNFAPSSSIMVLHCGHPFHNSCVREYWDAVGRNLFRCPLCRESWNLHSQAGIIPECLDVWDLADVTSARHARDNPDWDLEESLYNQNENSAVLWSQQWAPEDGPRSLYIEMAVARRWRRQRNKDRRNIIADAGLGIANLDPPHPDA